MKINTTAAILFGLISATAFVRADIRINELLASNETSLQTKSGVTGLDWLELYNSGDSDVDVTGWFLGNDPTKKASKWPAIEGSCVVPAHGYKIVWCDGDGLCTTWAADEAHVACNISTEAGKHTMFLASSASADAIIQQVPMPAGLKDVSYGYVDSADGYFYFPTPTPGAVNPSSGRTGITPTVVFSEPHGYKNEPFELSLSCPNAPTATIYYTLNGSSPVANATGTYAYTGPIAINKTTVIRAAVPDANSILQIDSSASYLFVADILTQSSSTRPDGFPSGNVNGQSIKYGMRSASSLGDAEATARLWNGFTNGIRTASIVMDPKDLFDTSKGIYVNATYSGIDWERPTMLEQIHPTDTNDEFSVACGIRIRGAWSRMDSYAKHGFHMIFRSKYGMSSLKHPLFGKKGNDSFGKIDFRCEQNSGWVNGSSDNTLIHEVFSRDSQRDMGQPHNRSKYYHLFLNGCYWGVYQTEERVDQRYCADYLGGAEENYDVVRTTNTYASPTASPTYTTGVVEGETDAWRNLWDISMNQGYGTGKEANYYRVRGLNPDGTRNPDYPVYLNVTNLICFMLTSQYTADADSPANKNNMPNNIIAYRNRVDGDAKSEGFHWNRHDSEQSVGHGSFGSSVSAGTSFMTLGTRAQSKTSFADFNPQMLHYELCSNAEYKRTFADLVQKHVLNPNGALSQASCEARYRKRMSEIDDAVMAELARWGGSYTRSTWTGNCNKDLDFFAKRTSYLISNYRSLGWFPSIDAPSVTDSFGSQVVDGTEIDVGDRVYLSGSDKGTVYYTIDGSDPCLPDGSVSGNAATYVGGSSSTVTVPVFAAASTWKYSEDGAKPAADWYAVGYNDSAWKTGAGRLGFAGSGTFGTTLNRYVNGVSGTQVTTYYFRKNFTMPSGAEKLTKLKASLDCDDGYIVYINGVEVKRDQVSSDDYSAFATATNLGVKEADWTFAAGLLHEGENTIAVEVHQCNATSSDAWWSLALSYESVGSAVGGVIVPARGLKLAARVKSSSGEWSALSETEIATPTVTFYTGAYDDPVILGNAGSYVFSNATLNAGLTIAEGISVKIKADTNTVNNISSISAAEAEVRFTGEGTMRLEGADTLMSVSNLIVTAGTLQLKSTGVSATKTPVVNVLGFVEQKGGSIDLDLDVATTNQIYGIYVVNKDLKDADGKNMGVVYALFDGGTFNATVGGTRSAALNVNKGSVETTFKGGETVTAVLKGVEPRLVSTSGDLTFKRCDVTVSLASPSSGITSARVFKSDKTISVTDAEAHIVVDALGPDAEIFSSADRIVIDAGTLELVSSDDCFSAMNRIKVNGGLIYAHSTSDDVFDSNGDMEINGGTILAYTSAEGHEAFDVDPEQTEGGSYAHQLRINGGTIFATGGKSSVWPDDFVAAEGVTVFMGEDLSASDYSSRFLTLTGFGDTRYAARLPSFSQSKCAILATCPGLVGTPGTTSTAPTSGTQNFHDLYISGDFAEDQGLLRVYEIYGSTTGDGDTDEYVVLTNISSVTVQLYGMRLTCAKDDGKSDPKLDIVLGAGTIEPYGSVRLDQAAYADKGWSKITNGQIVLKLKSYSDALIQKARADFALFEECDGCGAALVATQFFSELEATADFWRSNTGPHVHVWGTPEYAWNLTSTGYKCTATATCTIKSSHVTNETVTATYRITRPATVAAPGLGVYTSTFGGDMFSSQTRTEEIPQLPDSSSLGSFSRYADFTVTGYTGATTLERFPVLVRLTVDSPAGFDYAKVAADGSDLCFADADCKPLPFEVEKWDSTGESLVWVLLPSMANGTKFTMFFGGTPTEANDPSSVWTDYVGVWHMSEASGTVRDATGHGLDAAVKGTAAANSVAFADGPAGTARQFATTQGKGLTYLEVPNYDSFGLGGNFTVQGWFKATACAANTSSRYFSRKDKYTDGNGWEFEQRYGAIDTAATTVSCRGASSGDFTQTVPDIRHAWLDLAVNYNDKSVQYYVNGSVGSAVTITAAATDNGKPLVIGCNPTGTEANWVGQIDEVRLRKGDVTADRIRAEHDTIASTATFLTAGKVQSIDVVENLAMGAVKIVPAMTTATVSARITSVGTGATACDVYLSVGTNANSLPAAKKIASQITGSFEYEIQNLTAETTYYYEITVSNDAAESETLTKTGSFTTKPEVHGLVPGATPATTRKTIQDAIDEAAAQSPAGTVVLADGLFTIDAALMVTGGVTLVGQGWDQTVLKQIATGTRVVTVNGGAKIEGVTLTGGSATADAGAGALVKDGTISWCCITNNHSTTGGTSGGGVSFSGGRGTIDHSIVAYNGISGGSWGGGIGGLTPAGAVLIDTCLIYANEDVSGSGGGIGFQNSAVTVTIRNCTITENTATGNVGGVYYNDCSTGGLIVLVNSIISNNKHNADESNTFIAKSNFDAAHSSNCLITGSAANYSTAIYKDSGMQGLLSNCLTGAPLFVNAANKDYRLSENSPAVGAGVAYSEIGKDLDKKPFAANPCIGCYEFATVAPAWDVPGSTGGINGKVNAADGTKFVSFTAISLADGRLTVCLEAGLVNANGQTFGLVCKERLSDAQTFTINVTLTDDGTGSATLGTLQGLTDKSQLFILGIGPAK